jgi:hypothetical protein
MKYQQVKYRVRLFVILMVIFTLAYSVQAGVNPRTPSTSSGSAAAPADTYSMFLPTMLDDDGWVSPFGVEASASAFQPNSVLLSRAIAMKARFARIGNQIYWKDLQPVEGDPAGLDFAALLPELNTELLALNSAGIRPVVTVNRNPEWAVVLEPGDSYKTCNAIAPDKYGAFAELMRALVRFYSKPPYNVHDWELGNEPDVDPDLAPADAGYGCWGNIDDPLYYGGEAYGEMLKVVSPVMRSQDSNIRIWMGGLLLDSPNTTDPNYGKPENFLRGVLAAGAAPHFDVLSYHWHPFFWNTFHDYDLGGNGNKWESLGGGTIGKARFIRQILADYGVTKPLFLNETGFGCIMAGSVLCEEADVDPGDVFLNLQASHLVRALTRALSEQVAGVVWYTLDGPGWRNSGLLENIPVPQTPRPAYQAYQVMATQLHYAYYQTKVDFGDPLVIEAYQFRHNNDQIVVVWTVDDVANVVPIAQAKYKNAFTRDGTLMPVPPLVSGFYQVPIGFSPIYIVRAP